MEGDVLQTDFTILLPESGKADIVGNLPYYITSDILRHLFRYADILDLAVLMMQREVADRVAAEPGTRDFGLLSCTSQMYGSVASLFTLPPEAFAPPPDVYSTVIRIAFAPRFAELGITDPAAFDHLLKTSFQQKRKTLLNNLRAAGFVPDEILQACTSADVDPTARAEALSLPQLARFFRALTLPSESRTP